MPTQVTEFKCPACTAPLHFSEETGRLECDYCGSSFTVAEVEAFSAEKEQQAAEAFEKAAAEARADAGSWERPDGQDNWGEEADHLKTYRCPSCGAELICDEATSALDVTVQKEILDLLRGLEGDLAILFICHDISLVQQFCHRVLVMHRGEIVEQGTPDEVICRPQHAYTRHLIDSVL